MSYTYQDIAKMIDHALLTPTLDAAALDNGCRMAVRYEIASVCILPYYVRRCTDLLADSTVLASTVIGFPHGGQATSTKIAESQQAITDGAVELDMVVNISAVLSESYGDVRQEIAAIVQLAHENDRKVKVIFENCYLRDSHKQRLCRIACEVGADWIKTSTGFGSGGATEQDVKLMVANATAPTQVKAAGGVRDLETVLKFRDLGATRVGASSTAAILDQLREQLGLPAVKAAATTPPAGY